MVLVRPDKMYVPINGAIHQLFCNLYVVIFALVFRKLRDVANCFSEQAIRNWENVWLMNDGEELVEREKKKRWWVSETKYVSANMYLPGPSSSQFKCHLAYPSRRPFSDDPYCPRLETVFSIYLSFLLDILIWQVKSGSKIGGRGIHTRHSVFSLTTTRSTEGFWSGSGATFVTAAV